VHDRIGDTLAVRIGTRIPYETLKSFTDRKQMMAYLRDQTYALGSSLPRGLKRRRRRK